MRGVQGEPRNVVTPFPTLIKALSYRDPNGDIVLNVPSGNQ